MKASIEEIVNLRKAIESKVAEIEVAVQKTLERQGMKSPFVTQAQAYKIYGRKNVTNWERWGLLTGVKDGEGSSQKRYDVSRLILLAGSANRCEYFLNKKSDD